MLGWLVLDDERRGPYCRDEQGCHRALRPHSAEIAAAWEAVIAMEARGLALSLWSDFGRGWGAEYVRGGEERYAGCAEGQESPALAVCRAALLAVWDDAPPAPADRLAALEARVEALEREALGRVEITEDVEV